MLEMEMVWDLDLTALMGKGIEIETRDGGCVRGKVTGVTFQDVIMFGRIVGWPEKIILDADLDVPFGRIASVKWQ